eukprot:TRINITY_DN4634_c0_g3_i1.p1 TRINITY_DN4634_c0_g3~~TRINITY_DN4634_c0_g3_i1.p1  ORF type:complete len:470 (-),score=68.89 TRINITY_DN4634_c0_g3_i1:8-1417(-)
MDQDRQFDAQTYLNAFPQRRYDFEEDLTGTVPPHEKPQSINFEPHQPSDPMPQASNITSSHAPPVEPNIEGDENPLGLSKIVADDDENGHRLDVSKITPRAFDPFKFEFGDNKPTNLSFALPQASSSASFEPRQNDLSTEHKTIIAPSSAQKSIGQYSFQQQSPPNKNGPLIGPIKINQTLAMDLQRPNTNRPPFEPRPSYYPRHAFDSPFEDERQSLQQSPFEPRTVTPTGMTPEMGSGSNAKVPLGRWGPEGRQQMNSSEFYHPRVDILPEDEETLRPDALHVYGVDLMAEEDVIRYFTSYNPLSIEWINDSSCNVVFSGPEDVRRAIMSLSITKTSQDKYWREGFPVFIDGVQRKLYFRVACAKDHKDMNTRGSDSQYYRYARSKSKKSHPRGGMGRPHHGGRPNYGRFGQEPRQDGLLQHGIQKFRGREFVPRGRGFPRRGQDSFERARNPNEWRGPSFPLYNVP